MADIKILDFARDVNANKQALIRHCKQNGKNATQEMSLSQVVGINNSINLERPNGACRIRYINYNGEILDIKYANIGDPIPEPTVVPTSSDTRIAFDRWVCTTEASTVEGDIDFGALFKNVVEIEVGEQKLSPIILDCIFTDEIGLSPKINLYKGSATVYIDWGDGTVDTVTSSATQHTYQAKGKYSIKIYGTNDTWQFSNSLNNNMLGSATYACALKKAIWSNTVTYLPSYTFHGCKSLEEVVLTNAITNAGGDTLYACESLAGIIIPKSIRTIPDYMCHSCSSLKNIVIENSISKIGVSSFHYCRSLADLILPNSITSLDQQAISQCYALERIVLPKSLVSVGNSALSGASFQSLILPITITSIGSNAFTECRRLTELVIPSSVATIGSGALSNCYALTNLIMPNAITSIRSDMLNECKALSNLSLPVNFAQSLGLSDSKNLTKECLLDIGIKLKDLTNATAQTLTFSKTTSIILDTTYVNNLGEIDNASATTLREFMQNKNWTISILS